MPRKTCSLLGHKFPAPISADELPEKLTSKHYFVLERRYIAGRMNYIVEWTAYEFVDAQRPVTLGHIATGYAHWTKEAAMEHGAALDAVTAHCVTHAA